MTGQSKRAIPRERPPSLSDFLKDWFGFQTTTKSFRDRSNPTSQARVAPHFPVLLVVRVSPIQFSILVAESLEGRGLLSPAGRLLFR